MQRVKKVLSLLEEDSWFYDIVQLLMHLVLGIAILVFGTSVLLGTARDQKPAVTESILIESDVKFVI